MFKELFPLAAQGAFSLLLSADEASGLMTVVVVPKHSEGGKDVPALAMPLKLTAVPDELDAGFVQALLSYSTHGSGRRRRRRRRAWWGRRRRCARSASRGRAGLGFLCRTGRA
jgi:PRTRC genetic system protein E